METVPQWVAEVETSHALHRTGLWEALTVVLVVTTVISINTVPEI